MERGSGPIAASRFTCITRTRRRATRRVTTTKASGTPSKRLPDAPLLRAGFYSANAENAIPRINIAAMVDRTITAARAALVALWSRILGHQQGAQRERVKAIVLDAAQAAFLLPDLHRGAGRVLLPQQADRHHHRRVVFFRLHAVDGNDVV